jgi:DNA-directed RNA polymerase specialized sigma24 family protein
MLLRKKRSWREIYIDDSVDPGGNWSFWDVPDSSPNPESFCLQREREEVLRRAIGDLRPRTRAVIELGQLQERSMKQTARVIGISTAAAKARLFHARRMLRNSKPLRTVEPSTEHRDLAHARLSATAAQAPDGRAPHVKQPALRPTGR